MIKDCTDSCNSDKTTMFTYAKYMYEIMKLESKTQDECVYLLSWGT